MEPPAPGPGPTSASVAPLVTVPRALCPQRTSIPVSRSVYGFCWWFVLAVHLVVGVFVLFAGFTHLMLSHPLVHQSTSALGISIPLKQLSGASYVLVAMLHFRSLFSMSSRSIRAGRLVLGSFESKASQRLTDTALTKPSRGIRHAYHRATTSWLKVFGTDGFLGINGRYFTGSLMLREALEVVLQSYQSLSLSHSVSRPWINHFAVASVVLNCWSTLAVRFAFTRGSVATRRLRHVVVDMYLDFVFGVILPVSVILPYAASFDYSIGGFPSALLLDDVWFANAVAESKQVLVTSYLDFVSSLFPQLGIFSCLGLLKKLVRRERTAAPLAPASVATIVPTAETATTSSFLRPIETESRAARIASACIAAWGAVILGLHLRAQVVSSELFQGCELLLRPWFVSNISCSVMYVNCYRRGISGSASELDAVLAQLHRPAVTRVVFTHCPALHMPSAVTEFHKLYAIEIQNCTVADWSTSAAVSHTNHPELMAVVFGNSNVTSVPSALLHDGLPRHLGSIGFYNSNLSVLPENIGDLWSTTGMNTLALERTRVRRLPPSLGRLRLQFLWLASSQIDEIPDGMLIGSALQYLWLSGNPLTRVPQQVGDTSQLIGVFVEDTNVSVVPAWVDAWWKTRQQSNNKALVSFSGSPVCAEGSGIAPDLRQRVCGVHLGTSHGFAPYELVAAKYPL